MIINMFRGEEEVSLLGMGNIVASSQIFRYVSCGRDKERELHALKTEPISQILIVLGDIFPFVLIYLS